MNAATNAPTATDASSSRADARKEDSLRTHVPTMYDFTDEYRRNRRKNQEQSRLK
jgi:hypothetical protein